MTNQAPLKLDHRQLVSVVICLSEPSGREDNRSFYGIGYQLSGLDLGMSNRIGENYEVDVHLVCQEKNRSLLIDCKTYGPLIESQQIEKYLNTSGEDVVRTGVSAEDPRSHQAEVAFFVLPAVTADLANIAQATRVAEPAPWGIIEFDGACVSSPHNEFTDEELSASLESRWEMDPDDIYLERLPFEKSSPNSIVASHLFQTLFSFLMSGDLEFSLEDICLDCHPYWDKLGGNQGFIADRIQRHMRTIRRTALKGWLVKVDSPTEKEQAWKFVKGATTNLTTIRSFRAKQERYIRDMEEGRNPRPQDYVSLDSEQLSFPVLIEPGQYTEWGED